MGGLRETFRGMMAASSRPWFGKAMTIGPLGAQELQRSSHPKMLTKNI